MALMQITPEDFNRAGDLLVERGFAMRFMLSRDQSGMDLTQSGVLLRNSLHHLFNIPKRTPNSVTPDEIVAAVGILLFVNPTH